MHPLQFNADRSADNVLAIFARLQEVKQDYQLLFHELAFWERQFILADNIHKRNIMRLITHLDLEKRYTEVHK